MVLASNVSRESKATGCRQIRRGERDKVNVGLRTKDVKAS